MSFYGSPSHRYNQRIGYGHAQFQFHLAFVASYRDSDTDSSCVLLEMVHTGMRMLMAPPTTMTVMDTLVISTRTHGALGNSTRTTNM